LKKLESLRQQVAERPVTEPADFAEIILNPSLELMQSTGEWSCEFAQYKEEHRHRLHSREDWIIIWKNTATGQVTMRPASKRELLAIKIIAEELPLAQAARTCNLPVALVCQILNEAIDQNILLRPSKRIRRDPLRFQYISAIPERYHAPTSFTLQWHLTQVCDLSCKHCYDRTARPSLPLSGCLHILDELLAFSLLRDLKGHISFTGGNPFLYQDFMNLYAEAADYGFLLSILGNPVSRNQLETLVSIQKPGHFQLSLEGLEDYNDFIRGPGHFARVIDFLALLEEKDISSSIMLTLTRENMDQILPLAEKLRGHTHSLVFSRLSQVGGGKDFALPSREEYQSFLESCLFAARENPILHCKDNLINILLDRDNREYTGGCTGFGCGAAFNFLIILPDGEVHACRKFPSPIGNLQTQSIEEVYESGKARLYRNGSSACQNCKLKALCGGCMAISYSFGLDISTARDPHCFREYLLQEEGGIQ
jgi:selenobiotic family peptide radical SAM maturase